MCRLKHQHPMPSIYNCKALMIQSMPCRLCLKETEEQRQRKLKPTLKDAGIKNLDCYEFEVRENGVVLKY